MYFLALLMALCSVSGAFGQNHPELAWQVIGTEHFRIYYHQGLERIADEVAEIVERAYGPVTTMYGFEPDGPMRMVLKDTDDIANGLTYYYDNRIEIWPTNLDYEFRGTSDWLWNVITHEFTHAISLQVARKGPRRMPALFFQYFGYQQEHSREDVLTGYPDAIASYPAPMTIVPMWFAEGTAQYQARGVQYDRWDTHRDMILRMATLNDGLLSYDEMGVFEKTSLGSEMVYDHGYGLVLYIVEQYGEDTLRAIFREASRWWRIDFDGALDAVLGVSGPELYHAWRAHLEARYERQVAPIRDHFAEGDSLQDWGYANAHPAWSPDGSRLAYLSNKGRDYLGTGLFVLSLDDDKEKIVGGATSSIAWAPDGEAVFFAKRSTPDRYGSRYWDLYRYDIESEKEHRITHGLRARYPTLSPDGESLAFIRNGRGMNALGVMRADGSDVRYLLEFEDRTELYSPKWSPDGTRIVFSIAQRGYRDIAAIPSEGGEIVYLAASEGDDRDPCWTPDGKRVLFASDVTGIFNLYARSLDGGTVRRLTNVRGGAFQPAVSPDGEGIAFSLYGSYGYEIRTLEMKSLWQEVDAATFSEPVPEFERTLSSVSTTSSPYEGEFSNLFLIPRFVVDDGKLKPGLYAMSGDVLDKQSLFAGGAIGANLDMDLFLIYEYRRHIPTIFIELYKQTRHVDERIESRDEDFIVYDRKYDLNEINIGARRRIGPSDEVSVALAYSHYNGSIDQSPFTPALREIHRSSFPYNYLKGIDLSLIYRYRTLLRTTDDDINPRGGRDVMFRYDRMFNWFLKGFNPNSSIIDVLYDRFFYDQLTLDWKEYMALPWRRHALSGRLYAGWIDRRVDDFFDYHIGGIQFMRGYTYYSMEGRYALMANLTYRFPILRNLGTQFVQTFFDKVYGAVYVDVGRAWDRHFRWDAFKKDVGGQLRLDAVSFYGFPTRLAFDAAYGLDEVEDTQAWKFYFSLLFGHLN